MTSKGIFAVVNQSTVVSNNDVAAAVPAFAHQLHYHVAPSWHIGTASVLFYPDLASTPKNAWIIAILDNADQAGALAYHSETPDGRPYGKVFAETCQNYGVNWTSAASHEIVEAQIDLSCNLLADDGRGKFYALEACDPVESTIYTYNGIELSDFVRPSWFDSQAPVGINTRWRTKGTEKLEPFQLDAGGYAVYYDLTAGKWSQTYNRDTYPAWRLTGKEFPGARTARIRGPQG